MAGERRGKVSSCTPGEPRHRRRARYGLDGIVSLMPLLGAETSHFSSSITKKIEDAARSSIDHSANDIGET